MGLEAGKGALTTGLACYIILTRACPAQDPRKGCKGLKKRNTVVTWESFPIKPNPFRPKANVMTY